jgi:hypothetical protein
MSVFDWRRPPIALALMVFVCLAGNGCGMAPHAETSRPTIRVAVGMTVDQLYAGSTYPFQDRLGQVPAYPGGPVPRDWVITEPYDLIYVYGDHELRENNLGGENYLLAITTDSIRGPIDTIHITFQNQALTLDEALAVTARLNDWFVAAGFHPLSADAPEPRRVVAPFFIEQQERGTSPYAYPITSYQDARAAFLDTQAKIIRMTPFELETADVVAGVEIVNARRQREDLNGDKHENNLADERAYFVNLSIAARTGVRSEASQR